MKYMEKNYGNNRKTRCDWVPVNDDLYVKYHDEEWGKPVHDDRTLFEFLILEGVQAGLSWRTVLAKRENYRAAFDNFDANMIAEYDTDRVLRLLENSGLIRNRIKIESSVINARSFLGVVEEFGSFDSYIWGHVDGKPIQSGRVSLSDIPSRTPESDMMSRNLKKRGFKFVGSTICYAFMQATGLVNDHQVKCFRSEELL